MKIFIAITAFILLASCGAYGPKYSEQDFPARSVSVKGESYAYRIYVPANRKPGEKLPIMLYLHGSNRRGTDNEQQLGDLAENIKGYPDRFSFIVVIPQCRPDMFWAGPMLEQAIAALDQTVKEFGGDENRLYIAGYSMGGFGTWQTAITYPDKFAAIVPVAGGVEPIGEPSEREKAMLSPQAAAAASSPNVYAAYAHVLKDKPVWIVHGEKDESIPVDQAQNMAAALKAAGSTKVVYSELPGVGHGSIVQAFQDPKLFEWLLKQRQEVK
jgi:predicted peptidase